MASSLAQSNPYGAAIMAGASVANSALNDKTNMTNGVQQGWGFDNSGFSVNVGTRGGSTQTTALDKSTSALGLSQLLQNPVVLVLLAFVAYEFAKHK
jgi:hypothetical protein